MLTLNNPISQWQAILDLLNSGDTAGDDATLNAQQNIANYLTTTLAALDPTLPTDTPVAVSFSFSDYAIVNALVFPDPVLLYSAPDDADQTDV